MQPTSPLPAIRAKCLDCVCYQPSLIKECDLTDCALWPFRMGKNPFRAKRELSDEQRKVLRDRLAASRAQRSSSE